MHILHTFINIKKLFFLSYSAHAVQQARGCGRTSLFWVGQHFGREKAVCQNVRCKCIKGNIWQISGAQTTSGSWLLTLLAVILKAPKEIHGMAEKEYECRLSAFVTCSDRSWGRRMWAWLDVGLFGNLCASFDWRALRLSLRHVAMPNPKGMEPPFTYIYRWEKIRGILHRTALNQASQSINQSVIHAFNYPMQFIWTRVHSKLLSKRVLLKQCDEKHENKVHTKSEKLLISALKVHWWLKKYK